jgi:hypothetical protein
VEDAAGAGAAGGGAPLAPEGAPEASEGRGAEAAAGPEAGPAGNGDAPPEELEAGGRAMGEEEEGAGAARGGGGRRAWGWGWIRGGYQRLGDGAEGAEAGGVAGWPSGGQQPAEVEWQRRFEAEKAASPAPLNFDPARECAPSLTAATGCPRLLSVVVAKTTGAKTPPPTPPSLPPAGGSSAPGRADRQAATF